MASSQRSGHQGGRRAVSAEELTLSGRARVVRHVAQSELTSEGVTLADVVTCVVSSTATISWL